MKIIINHESRLIFVGKTMLRPGTNVVESIDENAIGEMVKADVLEVIDSEEITDKELKAAIKTAYTAEVTDKLKALAKTPDLKKAADKKASENKENLAKMEAEIKAAKEAKEKEAKGK